MKNDLVPWSLQDISDQHPDKFLKWNPASFVKYKWTNKQEKEPALNPCGFSAARNLVADSMDLACRRRVAVLFHHAFAKEHKEQVHVHVTFASLLCVLSSLNFYYKCCESPCWTFQKKKKFHDVRLQSIPLPLYIYTYWFYFLIRAYGSCNCNY
jgi:hypothetical protein